jgi:A/G-specific adenine glycosylase
VSNPAGGRIRPAVSLELPRFPELPNREYASILATALVNWFLRHRREFPWRQTRDPYAIWVSEVMLQQTQASTVVPYFQRFLETFPNVQALAQASSQEVLQLWQGLGYYRRALALHEAARRIVASHGGQFPRQPRDWLRLPGVGRYTAHAVLSQAFDMPLPIVEANSARVYARLLECHEPIERPGVQRWLWAVAARLVPANGAGLFNQAVMELGATVCSVRQPQCQLCPVSALCRAYQRSCADKLPVRTGRRRVTEIREVCVVVRRGKRWLVLQRSPKASRWPSLWEFPHADLLPDEHPERATTRICRQLAGLEVQPGTVLTRIRYGVTRFRFAMEVWSAVCETGRLRLTSEHTHGRWLTAEQTYAIPLSAPHRRLLDELTQSIRNGRCSV